MSDATRHSDNVKPGEVRAVVSSASSEADGSSPKLSEILASIDTPAGRDRVKAYLATRPFPHIEANPSNPSRVILIDANGQRTRGRLVGRDFVPVP